MGVFPKLHRQMPAVLALVAGAFFGGADSAAAQSLSLTPAGFQQLAGWNEDNIAAALPAFLRSCAVLERQSDTAPLDPAAARPEFGRVGDWRPLCRAAAAVSPGNDAATRQFFESNFVPVLVRAGDSSIGQITAYWEVETTGSRVPRGAYRTAVYRTPPNIAALRGRLTREQVDGGALSGRGLELMYLRSAADLLTVQRQGSGVVHLDDGGTVRLVYDANNGIAPIGEEPPYVFFSERHGDGPVGAEGAVLTPGRSLAVDHHFIPLGMPLWLEARGRYDDTVLRRIVIAQDTGDGIAGPLRGDYFWGSGPAAAAAGSRFNGAGGYYLLLPRALALHQVAAR